MYTSSSHSRLAFLQRRKEVLSSFVIKNVSNQETNRLVFCTPVSKQVWETFMACCKLVCEAITASLLTRGTKTGVVCLIGLMDDFKRIQQRQTPSVPAIMPLSSPLFTVCAGRSAELCNF